MIKCGQKPINLSIVFSSICNLVAKFVKHPVPSLEEMQPVLKTPVGINLNHDPITIQRVKPAEKAMNINQSKNGGIDLNPAQMSIQVKKDGQEFKFNFNDLKIDVAQVTGATFTIQSINIESKLEKI